MALERHRSAVMHYCWDHKGLYECFDPLEMCPCHEMEDSNEAKIQCPECYDIEHGESGLEE